jgi:hypothetical protein
MMKDKELINEITNIIEAGVVVDQFATSRENVKAIVLRQICRATMAYLGDKIGRDFDAPLSRKLDAVATMLDWIGEIKDKPTE